MILHIDMDAFYASVEQRDNSALKDKCVIVGGTSGRGVVSAASYEARKFGVHSAMPIFQARRICPDGVYIHPRMARYREVSQQIMEVLQGFSPLVEPVSIDEAFVDTAGCERLKGTPETIARSIKARIVQETRLTCSIGVAPVRFLAKIASDLHKPDGLTVIHPQEVTRFIETLPIEKVPGVGMNARRILEDAGIRHLGDVPLHSLRSLEKKLGKFGRRLAELAAGIDKTPVSPDSDRKSISSEKTLDRNTRDREQLEKILLLQAQDVARDLRIKAFRARTITLKIKQADFKQFTRNKTIGIPTQSSETIYATALELFRRCRLTQAVRLIGVGASGFISDTVPVQMEIFASTAKSQDRTWADVDRALDRISEKFGRDAVKRAVLAGNRPLPKSRT
ncbi:MAG: DNA polymerase IV [Deltaproteobacteria bacterium]|nr:DNA polymerase IV [Deltaproteobacteria bacterium]